MKRIDFTPEAYESHKGQNVFFQENGAMVDDLTFFPTKEGRYKYLGIVNGEARWYDKKGHCLFDGANHGMFNLHIRPKLSMKDIAEHFKQFTPEEIKDIKTYLNG